MYTFKDDNLHTTTYTLCVTWHTLLHNAPNVTSLGSGHWRPKLTAEKGTKTKGNFDKHGSNKDKQ